MLRALGYQLILYSEFSQIDLTLTTIYHSLFWGRDIPVPFIGDRRTKGGTVGRPLDAASFMVAQLNIGIDLEGRGSAS